MAKLVPYTTKKGKAFCKIIGGKINGKILENVPAEYFVRCIGSYRLDFSDFDLQ